MRIVNKFQSTQTHINRHNNINTDMLGWCELSMDQLLNWYNRWVVKKWTFISFIRANAGMRSHLQITKWDKMRYKELFKCTLRLIRIYYALADHYGASRVITK